MIIERLTLTLVVSQIKGIAAGISVEWYQRAMLS